MNPNALIAFLDESEDAIQTIDLAFVTLEAEPGRIEPINAIFRAIHSVKGNSPFFGLMLVKRLTHRMEDLLALMRERKVKAGHAEISCLLAGIDLLKSMLHNVRQGQAEIAPGSEAALEAVIERLSGAAYLSRGHDGASWTEVWQQLNQLTLVRDTAQLPGAVGALRSVLASLAPVTELGNGSAAAGLDDRSPPSALDALGELSSLLEPPLDELLAPEPASRVRELLEIVQSSVLDEARTLATQALGEHDSLVAAVGFVPLLRETLLERVSEIRAALRASPASRALSMAPRATASERRSTRPPAPGAAGREKADMNRTMRVEESKIDEFLDYVGELIITREMFGNVGKRLRTLKEHSSLSTEFQRAMGAFTALSHNLQRSIMEVRKVPVNFVLQKVPRLVRDLADQAGKQASVTLVGSEICVDKSLIESFEAPLVHMVRNAVDHGLESPEERRRRNKPAAGRIGVVVTETSAEFVCSIRDDGGGIDVPALRNKAVRLGLLTERAASQLTDAEAYQLVFAAGLSTAREVTDVSGRGVGMDVVKRNVTELGGRIEIASEPGVGATFTIHLPKAVTVQILDGFLVQVGEERLVLPLRAISESFRPTPDQLHTVAERGECVSRRGRVFPLVRFNRLLALGAADRCPSEAIVVSVEVAGGRPAGLLVDQVLGVQQVVLREVAGIDSGVPVFAGGAVLGDGRVAMVVDVEKLGALVAQRAQA